MSNYLNADDQAKFEDLMGRFIDLKDDEMKELTALRKKSQEAKGQRAKLVTDVLEGMKKILPALTLAEIFGEDLNTVLADAGYVHESAIPKTGKGKAQTARAPRSTRPSDANPILLTHKAGKGRGFDYHEGRVYEGATDANSQPWVWAQFPATLLQFGQSEASLLSIATDAGKAHFETNKGKEELAKLVALSKEAKAKADAKAPAQPAQQPAAGADAKADAKGKQTATA